ncbi:MAG TPA: glycosyltransferase family 4 protein [Candidatus Paceibacterota bacterium]|nr:glycosyltransferase family 4 protein [Candidatus Paceibacterota bacterium]
MRLLVYTQAVDKNDPILGFFHAWLLEFAKHFERIEVICLKEGAHDLPSNVTVRSLGKEEGRGRISYVLRFYRYSTAAFLFGGVTHVFFHMGAVFNILAAPFFLLRHTRNVTFYWWKTHGKANHLKERLALKCTDIVVTAGSQSFGLATNKVRVVGHAIDTTLFSFSPLGERNPRACLAVGRIVPIKRMEVALETVEKLKDLPLSLTIIGNADNEVYGGSLRTMTKDAGLAVEFLSARPQMEIVEYYKKANILLHPSFEAGFDKVVLEAMACGVIPLTSIPSFRPILEPFGLFLPESEAASYASTVRRVVGLGHDDRMVLSERLRGIVRRDHSLETITGRIFGIRHD